MPDDDHRFSAPRPDPERIDLAAIKADLEFAIDQILRLHTQLAQAALGIIFSTAIVTTALGWLFTAHLGSLRWATCLLYRGSSPQSPSGLLRGFWYS
jgi:hypothetical protein